MRRSNNRDIGMERMLLMVERASLARFTCREKAMRLLQDSIHSANTVAGVSHELQASGVKPLISLCHEDPWQRNSMPLREDVSQPQDKAVILKNSKRLVEEYFTTPANVNLQPSK